ncbi:AAA family ATPase, partial [Candidatus Dependentiae bacterium]|nr:AAA family ATPase [Candidatus Dependentiae bacterium]
MTKKPLPIGIDNFKKIVDGNYYLIDKTLLIKDLVTRGSAVYLLPRPRRFGKTLNLHMLQCFFEKPLPRLHNPKGDSLAYLFEDKLVWQHEDLRALQGKFPIIALSFKDIKPLDWETCMRQCADVVAQEYQVHRYLLEDNVLSREEKAEFEAVMTKTGDFVAIQSSLSNLSRYLQRYHGVNVIILIDEYDAPIHAGYLYGFYDKIVSFMRTFFSSAFKGNHALERGIITGILRTAKEGIFSGPNNLDVYSNLDRFVADKFGFTQEEVDALLAYYRMTDQRDEIRKWYDGYRVPGTDLALYNPWSVLNCVQKEGVIAPYWANTSSHDLIKKQLTKVPAKILRELDLILQGNTEQRYPVSEGMVFPNMERTESAVWSLLVFSGYLTVSSIKFGNVDFLCTLNVPNQELYV